MFGMQEVEGSILAMDTAGLPPQTAEKYLGGGFNDEDSDSNYDSPRSPSSAHNGISAFSKAEEDLVAMKLQVKELVRKFSLLGIVPPIRGEDGIASEIERFTIYSIEQIHARLVVARMVSGAISSGAVKAETHDELESKKREIRSLRDKLQYYEPANYEVSEKNQEEMEMTQKTTSNKGRRKAQWGLGLLCATLCVGTSSFLVYKYIPWKTIIGQNQFALKIPGNSVKAG